MLKYLKQTEKNRDIHKKKLIVILNLKQLVINLLLKYKIKNFKK